jgi:hypothetical protein
MEATSRAGCVSPLRVFLPRGPTPPARQAADFMLVKDVRILKCIKSLLTGISVTDAGRRDIDSGSVRTT